MSRVASLRRVALFAGIPAVGAFSPIVVLPALTSALGGAGWASLAVAQATGAFGALIVNWGWNVQGPTAAASSDPAGRSALYAESIRSRALSAAAALPLAAVVAFVVAPSFKGSAAVMAVAVSLSGMLPTWYLIGRAQPLRMSCFDAFPRLIAAVLSAAVLALIPSDWVYPLILLLTTSVASAGATRCLTGRVLHRPRAGDAALLRSRWFLVTSGLLSSGYTSLAIPIVAVVSPGAVAVFAAAARFQGYGTLGLAAVTNAGQGWVSAHGVPAGELRRRRNRALGMNAAAGLLGGATIAVVLPLLSGYLFSDTVFISFGIAALVGATVLMLAVSMSTTFHLLVPTGRTRAVAVSGILTSIVGVPALIVLTLTGGSTGALIAVLLAETLSAMFQLVAYYRPGPAQQVIGHGLLEPTQTTRTEAAGPQGAHSARTSTSVDRGRRKSFTAPRQPPTSNRL